MNGKSILQKNEKNCLFITKNAIMRLKLFKKWSKIKYSPEIYREDVYKRQLKNSGSHLKISLSDMQKTKSLCVSANDLIRLVQITAGHKGRMG